MAEVFLTTRQQLDELLNPSQKSSLKIVLRMFEENLRQADSWLDGRQANGILYRQQLHLTQSQRSEAHKRIATALDEIAVFAKELALEQ
jgi:hypothetical protein